MNQLILDVLGNPVTLPESQKDGYHAEKQPLSVSVEMITGRMVLELRGNVWVVRYQYGFFDTDMKNKVITACEKGRNAPINCGFLAPDSTGVLTYRDFFVTSFSYPKFMWSRQIMGKVTDDEGVEHDAYVPTPMWGDFSLELREVKPSD